MPTSTKLEDEKELAAAALALSTIDFFRNVRREHGVGLVMRGLLGKIVNFFPSNDRMLAQTAVQGV